MANMKEIRNIIANIPLHFFLKHLEAINPSFVTTTKPLSIKIEEILYEGFK